MSFAASFTGLVSSRRRAAAPILLPAAQRTLRRCLVCGFAEVRTDEVVERGLVLLAACPRCDHRWTERLEPERAPAATARTRPELRPAA